MNIIEVLKKDAICTDLRSKNKEEMLEELVDLLVQSKDIKKTGKKEIFKKLHEREMLGSTGIGKGVAIPHAKADKIKKIAAAFGISKSGIDFKSLDGERTFIFFLLIAPSQAPGPHLKALAKISRLLDDKFVRDRLKSAKNPQEILKIIKEEEEKKIL